MPIHGKQLQQLLANIESGKTALTRDVALSLPRRCFYDFFPSSGTISEAKGWVVCPETCEGYFSDLEGNNIFNAGIGPPVDWVDQVERTLERPGHVVGDCPYCPLGHRDDPPDDDEEPDRWPRWAGKVKLPP